MNGSVDRLLGQLRLFTGRWKGGRVQIWSYTVSHRNLVIRVEEEGRRGNLHIICGSVRFIHGPTKWKDCSFEIVYRRSETPDESDDEFILKDDTADFEVRAGFLEVKENCSPVY